MPAHTTRRFKENWPIIRFVLVTLISIVGFYVLIHVEFVDEKLIQPYTHFVATASRAALRLFGISAGGSGTLIVSPEFSVNIKNVCNGLEVTAILFATILAFPATIKSKLIGLAIGYPVIFVVNLARVVVLFFLGFKQPQIFDTVHYFYSQAFVIIATVAVWFVWMSLFSSYGTKSNQAVSH